MLRLDMNLVFTIINLLIIYFLMKRFLFKPVKAILAKRQEEIDKQFAEADEAEKMAKELKAKYEESISGAAEEKAQIIADARMKAGTEYDRIVSDAQKQASKIITDAEKNAQLEQDKRMQQAREQIADLVVAATAKVVAEKNSEESNRELYNQFLVKAGEKVD